MTNIALIIAHNEEKTIANSVNGLLAAKEKGLISEIVLVNDGSTDKTSEIAKQLGAKVINLAKNVGKGQAFIEGVNYCAKQKATNVLTFDGDLLEVTPKQVEKLLAPLNNPKVKMSVGTIVKDMSIVSGERAIKMSALKPLTIAKNQNWIKHIQGFGLEATLNHYLGLRPIFLPKIFDKFGGRIYQGPNPFCKEVKFVKTNFKALPFERRGIQVSGQAFLKRDELLKRQMEARMLRKIKKMTEKRKSNEQITKYIKRELR
ncbi:MAG: glycosyltransferase family 2 protein [Candidatus ainarchaeum sp.]|nr:glycosyltransferase family 2 protein [Candidatus ainarchaeum sp.]